MWLLPPYTDQSSAIASLLRTEIQSHNITKEMLHNTEQRRLDAVGRCGRLEADVNVLNIAYTKASTSLQKCAEEFARLCADYSRVSAENTQLRDSTLKSQIYDGMQSHNTSATLDPCQAADSRSSPIEGPWSHSPESCESCFSPAL
ncbi:hypothetical protein DM02DRAFT_133171 [Periconia macrospinosa]|uniref:Uncharacterized protein n=1 Tax=Periconia macrospinosa TaxID=97972 RepID=A0A2V1DCW5_9PLEO|nr:hypothetical protein DM02DRAFT_133171 [Periconia macrospinosa]